MAARLCLLFGQWHARAGPGAAAAQLARHLVDQPGDGGGGVGQGDIFGKVKNQTEAKTENKMKIPGLKLI